MLCKNKHQHKNYSYPNFLIRLLQNLFTHEYPSMEDQGIFQEKYSETLVWKQKQLEKEQEVENKLTEGQKKLEIVENKLIEGNKKLELTEEKIRISEKRLKDIETKIVQKQSELAEIEQKSICKPKLEDIREVQQRLQKRVFNFGGLRFVVVKHGFGWDIDAKREFKFADVWPSAESSVKVHPDRANIVNGSQLLRVIIHAIPNIEYMTKQRPFNAIWNCVSDMCAFGHVKWDPQGTNPEKWTSESVGSYLRTDVIEVYVPFVVNLRKRARPTLPEFHLIEITRALFDIRGEKVTGYSKWLRKPEYDAQLLVAGETLEEDVWKYLLVHTN